MHCFRSKTSSVKKNNRRSRSMDHLDCIVTPERMFRSRLLDNCNESLPDLSRINHNSDQRGHVLIKRILNIWPGSKHASYEKIPNERRGSVPLVNGVDQTDSMDTSSSTPSKIANFFIRKGFKGNLKRTKSVTKLEKIDRKRAASNLSDHESSTFVGSLKRTMSLGRLNRKRNRQNPTSEELPSSSPSLNLINSRIRSSRSHESLLTSHVNMHAIDLTATDLDIQPLHSSILGQDHCFQVSTTNGSKYISCRTAEEREKWIGSLRKSVHPNQEHIRRTDNSLKLWIKEAKNVPSKKKYFCEICLDRTLYAKTSSKMKSEMLFWGEHFEFNNLRDTQIVTVNLYREADKKKKKDKNQFIGYVNIPASEITGRTFVEKWFNSTSGTVGRVGKENKSENPLIRIKARYHTVQILPVDMYKDLSQYLSTDYCQLCEVLEPVISVKDKEDIATCLAHVLQKLGKAKDFLTDIIMAEVSRLDNKHLTMRGNSIGTKAMEAYMKLVGEKYLQDTMTEFVKSLIESGDDCEVDPTKVTPQFLQSNQSILDMYSEMVFAKIINSHCYFPSELRDVFACFRSRCLEMERENTAENLISASLFLRFLCPAIMSPSLFNLIQEYPPDKAARNLVLLAKTIQTLANFTKFGAKEEYMTFMNDFIERHSESMNQFLQQISSTDTNGGNQFLEFDGYIDLGKELSILHSLLTESLEKCPQDSLSSLGKLPSILSKLKTAFENPDVGLVIPPPKQNRKSQIYDNLVNMPPQTSTSPTEIVREMLKLCGGEDIPVLSGRRGSRLGVFDSENNVETDDDFGFYKNSKYDVSNVSVKSVSNEQRVNESWSEIVNVAESHQGDYIDLLHFADEDVHNSSMDSDHNMNGSEISISQISTIASSGYQSFGYSQSSSPIDPNTTQDFSKSHSSQAPLQPLSFSNPVYRHQFNSAKHSMSSPNVIRQGSSSGSASSEEDTVKHRSPVKSSDRELFSPQRNDPLRNLAPKLSSSSSSESLEQELYKMTRSSSAMSTTESTKFTRSNSVQSSSDAVKFSLDLHSSVSSQNSDDVRNSNITPSHTTSNHYSLSRAPSRPKELSHTGSMDFSHMRQRYNDPIRRTATDSHISSHIKYGPSHAYSNSDITSNSSRYSDKYYTDNSDKGSHKYSFGDRSYTEDSDQGSRKLSPNNAVHMGIKSVQRKIQEQEKTKQEYESEVETLRQQLNEAQDRLQQAEDRLKEHETGTQQLVDDWQFRLSESEERLRKQQVQKDDQMKQIIQRLMTVEKELKADQEEMQSLVRQKQRVIEAQERRIQTLDNANAKLMTALSQLRSVSQQNHNGMIGPLRSTILTTEIAEFKTSSC
ncbi:disabled homolog 2-interacting protein-like isoform X6 [Mytilus californianus]|uniref:disabled homolog 2-interacting protein-like isoform X6 n=1 Tax=Mytilus californianus TaxID=6549 RepID=UPI002245990B|nr:disabled homolog 2-interacting protein-like isoform X6 [Mytilus californianus]